MTRAPAVLDALRQRQPEWTPWLAVVEAALDEGADPAWDGVVQSMSGRGGSDGDGGARAEPLLAGRTLVADANLLRRMLTRLITTASATGTTTMAPLDRVLQANLDLAALFAASVCHDREHFRAVASRSGVDPDALHAVAALLCWPFLQAYHRRFRRLIPQSWARGYCPVCAAWPAVVEERGIERQRYARCGRCGAEWQDPMLRCRYCGTVDHEQLVALSPQVGRAHASVEACTVCGGYTKTFTRLQGCASNAVLIEDLESVDLDLAALDEGYTRPEGLGQPLYVTVVLAEAGRPAAEDA